MSILSAFNDMKSMLLESASTDEFKQLLNEIAVLDTEIATLHKEMSDSWENDYTAKFKNEQQELIRVRKDLDELVRTYRKKYYTEWDADGDPVDFEYSIDTVKQKEESMLEATIRKKLEELEAIYNGLKRQAENDHATAFSSHKRQIRYKSTSRDDKKKRKEELLKAIIEEERPELQQLIDKISKVTKVTTDIDKISFHDGKLFLSLISDDQEREVDPWDDIEFDDGYAYVKVDKLVDYVEEYILEEDFIADVAFALEIDEESFDAALNTAERAKMLDIPNSTWKFLVDFDIEHNEPEVSRDGDEVEDFIYNIICYLVKEI